MGKGRVMNGRKRTALVDVFAVRLVLDGEFGRCSCKVWCNAGTGPKRGTALRSHSGWAQVEAVRVQMGDVKHYAI